MSTGCHDLSGFIHHITIISPREASDLSPEFGCSQEALLQKCCDAIVWSKFCISGVRKVTKLFMNENDDGIDLIPTYAYHVFVKWKEDQNLRCDLGLNRFHLKITLGVSERDLYGVPKTNRTLEHHCDSDVSWWT